jgi:riboflavin biosynthesis pyrimidine reductase
MRMSNGQGTTRSSSAGARSTLMRRRSTYGYPDWRIAHRGASSSRNPVTPAHAESPTDIATLDGVDHLLVEGGAETAAAFLRADLVDRLLLYRAPILIGGGRTLPDIGLTDLAAAHGRWTLDDTRRLGSDRLDIYERTRS